MRGTGYSATTARQTRDGGERITWNGLGSGRRRLLRRSRTGRSCASSAATKGRGEPQGSPLIFTDAVDARGWLRPPSAARARTGLESAVRAAVRRIVRSWMSREARYALAALLGGSGTVVFADDPFIAGLFVGFAAALIVIPELASRTRVRGLFERAVWKLPRPLPPRLRLANDRRRCEREGLVDVHGGSREHTDHARPIRPSAARRGGRSSRNARRVPRPTGRRCDGPECTVDCTAAQQTRFQPVPVLMYYI
jgi:hypothetical protein